MTDPRDFDRRIETNRQLNPDSGADTPPAPSPVGPVSTCLAPSQKYR